MWWPGTAATWAQPLEDNSWLAVAAYRDGSERQVYNRSQAIPAERQNDNRLKDSVKACARELYSSRKNMCVFVCQV